MRLSATTENKIEEQLRKELKSSLFYLLRIVDHEKFFYAYEESYKKSEILEKFLERKELWYKLEATTYKKYFAENKFGAASNVSKDELVTAMHETAKHQRRQKAAFRKRYNTNKRNENTQGK